MLDTKKTLAANLSALLDSRPDISRLDLSKQMKVADGTLGRIKYGTGNPTVEVLEQIARFFRIEAWQLLVPNLGKDPLAAMIPEQVSDLVTRICLLADKHVLEEHDLMQLKLSVSLIERTKGAVFSNSEIEKRGTGT